MSQPLVHDLKSAYNPTAAANCCHLPLSLPSTKRISTEEMRFLCSTIANVLYWQFELVIYALSHKETSFPAAARVVLSDSKKKMSMHLAQVSIIVGGGSQ